MHFTFCSLNRFFLSLYFGSRTFFLLQMLIIIQFFFSISRFAWKQPSNACWIIVLLLSLLVCASQAHKLFKIQLTKEKDAAFSISSWFFLRSVFFFQSCLSRSVFVDRIQWLRKYCMRGEKKFFRYKKANVNLNKNCQCNRCRISFYKVEQQKKSSNKSIVEQRKKHIP